MQPKNVTIGPSRIEGKGLIALRDFQRGDVIFPLEGTLLSAKDPHELDYDTLDHAVPIDYRNGIYYFIGQPSLSNMLNHSCEPNAGLRNNKDFVAMRSIKKGDEIVIDYAIVNIDGFSMKCDCKSKSCRREVMSFEKLDPKTQKRYLPFVLNIIRDKYEKQHAVKKAYSSKRQVQAQLVTH